MTETWREAHDDMLDWICKFMPKNGNFILLIGRLYYIGHKHPILSLYVMWRNRRWKSWKLFVHMIIICSPKVTILFWVILLRHLSSLTRSIFSFLIFVLWHLWSFVWVLSYAHSSVHKCTSNCSILLIASQTCVPSAIVN